MEVGVKLLSPGVGPESQTRPPPAPNSFTGWLVQRFPQVAAGSQRSLRSQSVTQLLGEKSLDLLSHHLEEAILKSHFIRNTRVGFFVQEKLNTEI